VLLAAVTLEDPRADIGNAKAAARHNNDEVEAEEGAAKAEDPPNAKFSARIGVFLAAARLPKKQRRGTSARPHRAALLWRGRAGSAAALSEALGRAVGAARLLSGAGRGLGGAAVAGAVRAPRPKLLQGRQGSGTPSLDASVAPA
jgi:hypothetical protein